MHDPAPRPAAWVRRPFALIAAVARNGVIGVDNRLPWRLPEDLRVFRTLTTGHAVIMGRRTWESIGRPLPDRQSIVVTRRADYHPAGAQTASTLAAAMELVRLPTPVFCIGGNALFREALPIADTLYLTEIDREFAGDASFPPFDRSNWHEVERLRRSLPGPDGFDYAFVTYARRAAVPV